MIALALLLLVSAAGRADGAFLTPAHGFVVSRTSAAVGALSATAGGETEIEALLRKARELKAAAAADEESLRSTLCDKKAKFDAETDAFVKRISPEGDDGEGELISRLRTERPSTAMLKRVIERLHGREVAARGHEHVESSSDLDHTKFEVVAEKDEAELNRVEGLIDRIIDAAVELDKERLEAKAARGEEGVRHHAEVMHFAEGDVAKVLRDKISHLRREHEEQFQKRQKSFYDAARIKDKKAS